MAEVVAIDSAAGGVVQAVAVSPLGDRRRPIPSDAAL